MQRHGQHKDSWREGASRIRRLKDYFGNRKNSLITAGDIEGYRIERQQEPDARDQQPCKWKPPLVR